MSNQLNSNPQPELSQQDAELLSAYLDAMLSDREQQALENRLQTDAFLRAELSAMRQTVSMINALPTLKAPRDFTITAEDVAQDKAKPAKSDSSKIIRFNTPNLWAMASTAAALILVVIGVLVILPNSNLSNTAPADQAESVALQLTAPNEPSRAIAASQIASTQLPPSDSFNIETADGDANTSRSMPTNADAPPAPETMADDTVDEEESDNVASESDMGQGGGVFTEEGAEEIELQATSLVTLQQAIINTTATVMSFSVELTPTPSTLNMEAVDGVDMADDNLVEEEQESDAEEAPAPVSASNANDETVETFNTNTSEEIGIIASAIQPTNSMMDFINAMRRVIAEARQ